MKRAEARTPLIATALVAVIGVFWFLSISRRGNTDVETFAEAKQRESARAKATVKEVEPGPDDPESPVPRGRDAKLQREVQGIIVRCCSGMQRLLYAVSSLSQSRESRRVPPSELRDV